MFEDKISKLYKDYCAIFGIPIGELDEWEFKMTAIEDYPELRLDVLAWTLQDIAN